MQTRKVQSVINAERADRGLDPLDTSDSNTQETLRDIVQARDRKTVGGRLMGYREQLRLYGMDEGDVTQVIGRLSDSFHGRADVIALPEEGMSASNKAILTGDNVAQRVAAFGSTAVDDVLQGSGRLVKSFGETLAANPLARYALEGIDFAAGPAVWAARKVIMEATPIGVLIEQGQGKIIGRFADQFASVGYSADDALDGGVGGLTLGTMMASGAAGALSRLSGLSNVLAGARSRLSAMVPDVHVAPFAPELSRGSSVHIPTRGEQLRAKYGTLTAADVDRRINLRGAVADEYAKRAANMSNGQIRREIGPALAGVMDTKTGEIFFGVNAGPRMLPNNLTSELAGLIDEAKSIPYIKTHGAGTHAEVYALNSALQARPGAAADDFLMYVINSGQRGSPTKWGQPIPRCPHCEYITNGVKFFPESMIYGK